MCISLGTAFTGLKKSSPWGLLKPVFIKLKERYEKPRKQVDMTKPARLGFPVKLVYPLCQDASEILPVCDLFD